MTLELVVKQSDMQIEAYRRGELYEDYTCPNCKNSMYAQTCFVEMHKAVCKGKRPHVFKKSLPYTGLLGRD